MKTKNEDLRVIKTKKLIKDSFFELIGEKGYSKVTVTDITKKANINRNTFYLHYVDKEDLVDQIITDNYKESEPKIINLVGDHLIKDFNNLQELQVDILHNVIDFLLEEIEFYRILLMDPGLNGYLNKLKNSVKAKLKKPINYKNSDQLVNFEFIFEGTYGVLMEWIKSDFISKDVLADKLSQLLNNNWNIIFNNNLTSNIFDYFNNRKKQMSEYSE